MKKSLLFLLIAAFAYTNCIAQITLTSDYAPVPGDIFYTQGCDTNGVQQGSGGANVVWNFSSLSLVDAPVTATFVDPATTSGSQFFPGATVAHLVDTSFALYYTVTNNNYVFNGISGDMILEQFSDPQLIMSFPFTYNSSFSDPFYAVSSMFGFDTYHSGTTEVKADGYGSLILPGATYPNVLRVKSNVSSKDSANFFGQITITYDSSLGYSWFADGMREPIFQIVHSSNTSQGVTNYSKAVAFRTTGTGIPEKEFKDAMSVYPNPLSGKGTITTRSNIRQNAEIRILDLNGSVLKTIYKGTLNTGTNSVSFSTDEFASGVYFLQLLTPNENRIVKLMVK